MALSNSSFATYLIVCPTCFFLGAIFSMFPYDYPLLWSATPAPASHYDFVETHLRFLHDSPPLIPRILHIVMFVGLGALISKLHKPTESNMLFDGASLVLYMCGLVVYFANIVKGMRIISIGDYGQTAVKAGDEASGDLLGREDSLKVLAASNTILALVLVGVLVLQAGQWYAERASQQETEDQNKKDQDKKDATTAAAASGASSPSSPPKVRRQSSGGSTKKKQ